MYWVETIQIGNVIVDDYWSEINRERFYREIQAFIENIAEFEIESNDFHTSQTWKRYLSCSYSNNLLKHFDRNS